MTGENPNRPLTAKQERFAIEYVRLGNASEAYRIAYDASGMLPATVHRCALEVIDNPKVSARIAEEKERVVGPVRASAAWIVSQAAEIAESESAPHAARVSALALLAKRFPEFRDGALIDNRTVSLSGLTDEQVQMLADGLSGD